jgi:hypothetical protein
MQIKSTGTLAWALAVLALPIVVGAPLATHAQDQANPPSSTAPDNSARNKAQTNTADNQNENTSDREITRKIRRSITAEKSLSTYAHNVKIIAQYLGRGTRTVQRWHVEYGLPVRHIGGISTSVFAFSDEIR